jgi:hypothetical protein
VIDRALWANFTKTGYEYSPRTCWHYSSDFNEMLVAAIIDGCMPFSNIRLSVFREQKKVKKKKKNRD